MTRRIAISLALVAALLCSVVSSAATPARSERLLRDWTFNGSQKVRIPHDWAIAGPFNGSYDFQTVAVTQNGETEATAKTGRTGGLPWIGEGSYECSVDIDKVAGKKWTLLFDGAMSDARVYVNGELAGQWPYGYNSFYFDITDFVKDGANTIKVLLNNLPESSRWYPGAG
ncbi:MAG: beta-galactosidase, partial [Bacteroidales bacterium]|nr:beta-galactosidase [Bacteroidales bacterium]